MNDNINDIKNDINDLHDRIKKMRNGEKIKCPRCEDGYFSAVENPKTTHIFRCNACETGIVLTIAHTWEDGIRILKNKRG